MHASHDPTQAHALVIAVSQYQHIPPLPQVADADDLAAVLRDPSACGYHPASVVVLQEAHATRAHILDELDRLAHRAPPASSVLVYFSGHGGRLSGDGSDAYLMPIDGAWGSPARLDDSAISSRLLGDKLAAIPAARLTVILDCCHAAHLAHAREVVPAAWTPGLADQTLTRLAGEGRVVMAASRGDGAAHVMAGARHGLFTEHLIAGLRGAAAGPDGVIRVLSLYDHVQRNVVARHPAQRPVLKANLEDNYPIAHAPRARPAPAAPTAFAYDVLLVFSPDDRDAAWARHLIRLLEDRSIRVCAEHRDAELGGHRLLELERLVSTSRYTVPILTPRFSTGRFEELQTLMAQHLGVVGDSARLIPILREPCDPRLGLRVLVSLDMTRDENVVPAIDRLVDKLRRDRSPTAAT